MNIRLTLLRSLIAIAMAFGISESVRAQACTQPTVRGTYLFRATGWNITNGTAVPKAILETITFNGDGTLVAPVATVSVNGTITRSTGATGTYTLAADWTGTITFTPGPTFDIYVEPGGKQMWLIQTGPGPAVFEGTATRVSQ